ncbi:MAG: hypothetical protein ABNH26_03480 [Celeribacter sp.]
MQNRPVTVWGDSLSAGAGASGAAAAFPAQAAGLPTVPRDIENRGVGGQSSTQIAARQGGVPITVTVPAGAIPARIDRMWNFTDGLQGWGPRRAVAPHAEVTVEGDALRLTTTGTAQSGAQLWLDATLPAGTVVTVEFDLEIDAPWLEVGLVNAESAAQASGGWAATTGFSQGGHKVLSFTVGDGPETQATALLFMAHTHVGSYRIRNLRVVSDITVALTGQSIDVLIESGSPAGEMSARIGEAAGIVRTDAQGNWSFARSSAGAEVACPGTVTLRPDTAGDTGTRTLWIWAGRNNHDAPEAVKSDIAAMVAHAGHGHFLVGSVLTSTADTQAARQGIVDLNAELSAIYDTRFVDLMAALGAASDGGAEDSADIADDLVPRSLRSDAVHLNDAGYGIVALAFSEARY